MAWNLAPIGCKAAIRNPDQGGPCKGPTGPGGWVWVPPPSPGAPELHVPPTPALAGPTGPASLYMDLSPGCWVGTRYYPLPVPTQPCTTPGTPSRPAPVLCTVWTSPGTAGAVGYDRFEDTVGEPRGVGTQPYFRVPDWFIEG